MASLVAKALPSWRMRRERPRKSAPRPFSCLKDQSTDPFLARRCQQRRRLHPQRPPTAYQAPPTLFEQKGERSKVRERKFIGRWTERSAWEVSRPLLPRKDESTNPFPSKRCRQRAASTCSNPLPPLARQFPGPTFSIPSVLNSNPLYHSLFVTSHTADLRHESRFYRFRSPRSLLLVRCVAWRRGPS